jgi:hypothetical protein
MACAGIFVVACNGKLVLDKASNPSNGDAGEALDAGNSFAGSAANAEGGSPATGGTGAGGTGGSVFAGDGPGGKIATGGTVGTPGTGGTLNTFTCPGTGGTFPFGSGGGAGYIGITATTHWNGNPSKCPSTAPDEFSDCTAPEGTLCAFNATHAAPSLDAGVEMGSGFFTCVSKDQKTDVWYKTSEWDNPADCPATQPAEGATCEQYDAGPNASCYYPGASCWCIAEGGAQTWRCIQQGTNPPAPPGPPASPHFTKHVNDLDDAERESWCEWYSCDVAYNGAYPVETQGGYTIDPACAASDAFTNNGTFAQLPVSYCKDNLALSTCEAPISDLSDCVLTFRTNTPSPGGCGRYFATPGCSGTIVVANDENYKGGRGGASGAGPGLAIDCSVRVY